MTQTEEIHKGIKVVSMERVPINNRLTLNPTAEGVVVDLDPFNNTAAIVAFRVPNTPSRCEKCGRMSGLSVNYGTGEIECLVSGCGHEHGFRTATVSIPISRLKTLTSYIEEIQRKEWESNRSSQEKAAKATSQALADLEEEGRQRGWM